MTVQGRNEAAERLQSWLEWAGQRMAGIPQMSIVDEALAAERRATVERIILNTPPDLSEQIVNVLVAALHTEDCVSAFYQDGGQSGCICGVESMMQTILDEEAAR